MLKRRIIVSLQAFSWFSMDVAPSCFPFDEVPDCCEPWRIYIGIGLGYNFSCIKSKMTAEGAQADAPPGE